MRCTDLITNLSVSFPERWMVSPVLNLISGNCRIYIIVILSMYIME